MMLGLLLCLCLQLQDDLPAPSARLAEAFPEVAPLRIGAHVTALGGDDMGGRGTGSPGESKAAAYIASVMAAAGLKPMGEAGSWYQQMPLHGSLPLAGCDLQVYGAEGQTALTLGDDYLLFTMGDHTLVPTPARLVFVGYGIVAPEYDYNDYQDLDVAGAVVVYLAGEPGGRDPSFFGGPRPTEHALPELKQRVAASRGARGTLMIPEPVGDDVDTWAYLKQVFAFEHVTLPFNLSGFFSGMLNPAAAPRLFEGARHSFEDVLRMEARGDLRSFALKQKMTFKGRFRERNFLAANVLGALPGSDPAVADDYVLVCAHYDHLGTGPAVGGDAIYNGVVDNALGVGAALELARVLAERGAPRRSVLFLFVTGEEKGLIGSRYYCDAPVVPLARTIACLNIDGPPMFDTFREVIGVGADLSTLGTLLRDVAGRYGLATAGLPDFFGPQTGFDRSDQLSFAQAGVPALLVSEGFVYDHTDSAVGTARFLEWGRTVYHTPFDDLNQPINYAATAQFVRLTTALVRAMADTDTVPHWTVEGRYQEARLKSLARAQ